MILREAPINQTQITLNSLNKNPSLQKLYNWSGHNLIKSYVIKSS